ncbi:hypothetical protein BYT27DRAFT_7212864 [Phlegmacium glaucopus]|nr:hypothetical protein BYT27DRAFT_7212864 [Phlegmacium glaucopus]
MSTSKNGKKVDVVASPYKPGEVTKLLLSAKGPMTPSNLPKSKMKRAETKGEFLKMEQGVKELGTVDEKAGEPGVANKKFSKTIIVPVAVPGCATEGSVETDTEPGIHTQPDYCLCRRRNFDVDHQNKHHRSHAIRSRKCCGCKRTSDSSCWQSVQDVGITASHNLLSTSVSTSAIDDLAPSADELQVSASVSACCSPSRRKFTLA